MNTEYYEQKTKRLYDALEKAEAERDSAEAAFEVKCDLLAERDAELEKAKAQIIADDSKILWQGNEIADLMGEVAKLRDGAQAVFGTDLTSANKLIETNKGLGAELDTLHERYLGVMQENKTLKRTINMIEGAK